MQRIDMLITAATGNKKLEQTDVHNNQDKQQLCFKKKKYDSCFRIVLRVNQTMV